MAIALIIEFQEVIIFAMNRAMTRRGFYRRVVERVLAQLRERDLEETLFDSQDQALARAPSPSFHSQFLNNSSDSD